MKFLHTADWQIGMKAYAAGRAAERVRQERFAAAGRVVEAAHGQGAEFILLAGDVFEDNGVDRRMVQATADILSRFAGPVFIIPGNHDPFQPGCVWEHPAWGRAGNIHLLTEERPVEVPGGFLYPCPVKQKHSALDPTAWIPQEPSGNIRIGMAHGTVEGVLQDEPESPIPRNAPARTGLHYLALGHYHSVSTYRGSDGNVSMAYSGTHEATGFGERDSGNVLLVEIPSSGGPVTISPVATGGFAWTTLERDVRQAGDLSLLREQIESLPNPGATLLDLRISGVLNMGDQAELEHLEQILESRFITGRLDASGLIPSPADDEWVDRLPPGIIQDAAHRLRDTAASGGEGSPVASRALLELYAVMGEVRR